MELAPGLRASVRITVGEADTAIAAGSGDVPVLGTPRLLALAEAASVAAVEPHLVPGMTSVGTAVSLEHRRPSPVGTEITVEAELTEVAGRRLVFSFIARHSPPEAGTADGEPRNARYASGVGEPPGTGEVPGTGKTPDAADSRDAGEDLVAGAGTLERVVVDREKFLARALA